MRRFAVSFACAMLSVTAAGAEPAPAPAPAVQPPQAEPAPRPKLIVAIAVDQYGADLFAQYRQHYHAGIGRLLNGAVFPSGYQSHNATETCPGHSTILTGDHPARTGIIANNWYVPTLARAEKRVYCAEDELDPASSSKDPVVSPRHLRVPTLGELMKDADPAARNVAVSAKDRAVMMMGGHKTDAAYWWNNGQFVTLKGRAVLPAVAAENAEIAGVLKAGAPAFTPPTWCQAYARPVPVAGAGTIGEGRFALPPNQPELFRVSPRMDAATGELAARLVDEMKLGQGKATDLLAVSFSATDYVDHAFGTEGLETCVQTHELDLAIGKLLDHLDARGIDYVVVLTADHGGLDTPERIDEQAWPSATRVDPALTAKMLGEAVAEKTGIRIDGPLLYADGPFGDYWFNAALTPAQKAEASEAMLAIVRAHPQVAAAWNHAELAAAPLPKGDPQTWSLLDRARADHDAERSGDVLIRLTPAVVPLPQPAPGYTATHGSPWDYDRRVAILFWSKHLAHFEQPLPIETTDIAPTLAALIGLKVAPGTFDGRCLDLDPGPGDSCALK
jgi:predicted AlkP superfamily pyrophosphatase or phosphodiesterase